MRSTFVIICLGAAIVSCTAPVMQREIVVISVVGTNDVHGNIFAFIRNKRFDARNPFSTVADPALAGIGSSPSRLAAIGQPVSVCHQ